MSRENKRLHLGLSLDKIIENSDDLKIAYKSELDFGDTLIIQTRNSSYFIFVLGYDSYLVLGGWFDRKGMSPKKTSIAGCTWGGHILKTDIVAAGGLRLEFGNRVVTSRIKKIVVLKGMGIN
ncbi:MAG: hypothetical protein PVF22_02665 [Candidatus Aminicenantes bacterium]